MKPKISPLGLTAILLASIAGTPALALEDGSFWDLDSWYVGGAAGWNWQQHPRLYVPGTGPEAQSKSLVRGSTPGLPDYDSSWMGLFSVGRSFSDIAEGFRAELEAGYRDGSIRRIDSLGAADGHSQAYSGMLNGLYDFDFDFPLKPYLGVGVGVVDYQTRNIHLSYAPGPASSASSTTLGYQGIAGIEYALTPQLKLGVGYRYFGSVDHPTGTANSYKSQSTLLTVRYAFGGSERHESTQAQTYVAPPPAPPPPERPGVPHSYLVFFDFDKSDLTPEARQIVDQAAQNAKTASVTRIDVTGHTDTVGSDAYNLRLSRRRALSVSAELQRGGVPESEIAIFAKGKRDLLVPTADGVKEPQNRRVQIVFSDGTSSS